jgi:iron-sulfur cluster assembly accessory protein
MLQSMIELSPSAASRVRTIAERQGKPAVLRLTVEGGGCAGFQYRFGLAEGRQDGDFVSETDGVELLIDEMSLPLIEGSIVDFVSNLGGASFQVRNPNAASSCGCGTSFSV